MRYWQLDEAGGQRRGPSQAATLNIGTGGAFILTAEPAPTGARLEVEVDLPDGGVLALAADVRWIGEGDGAAGMGVRFTPADDATRDALSEHFGYIPATLDFDEG